MKHSTFVKHFLPLVLAVSIWTTCLPFCGYSAFAATAGRTVYSTPQPDLFDYLIEKVNQEEGGYMADRMEQMFYGPSDLNLYYVGEHFPSSMSYQTLYDGETGKYVALKSSTCYAYSEWVFYKCFGYSMWYGDNDDLQRTTYNTSITASNMKSLLKNARCGAHLRVKSKHSITFVTETEDGNGFYYLDASNVPNPYTVRLVCTTYDAFASYYSGRTLEFIQLPGDYPKTEPNADIGSGSDIENGKEDPDIGVENATNGQEVWAVQVDDLNVRADHSTSSSKTGYQYNTGDKIVVTAIYKDSNYIWGKTDKGWCVLYVLSSGKNYATYESGYLYQIEYNLNGGTGTVYSTPKAYDQAVTLSNVTPTREGYAFLGWANDANASSAAYMAGATYAENASAVLYAVWEAKSNPDQSGGTVDGTRIIDPIAAGTTVAMVYENFSGTGTPKIYDKEGKEVAESSSVCTGMILEVNNENTVIRYAIPVMGDANGDGQVSSLDLSFVAKVVSQIEADFEPVVEKAIDVDMSNDISSQDLTTFSRFIGGIEESL